MRLLLLLAFVGLVSVVSGHNRIQLDIKGRHPAEWKFIEHPLKSPNDFDISFWLKAKSDAHLRLSSKSNPKGGAYYELYIDYHKGKFFCIFRNGEQMEDFLLDEPLLSSNGFVDFRLKRKRGDLCLLTGKGKTIGCIWEKNYLKNVKFIGVTSYIEGESRTPSWWRFNADDFKQPAKKIQLDIPGSKPAVWKFVEKPLKSPLNFDIRFWVKARSDAYLRLSSKRHARGGQFYDLYIDYYDGKYFCIFRNDDQMKDFELKAPLLKGNAFVDFRLKRKNGDLCLLTGKGKEIGCLWEKNYLKNVKYIGVTSYVLKGPNNRSWWRFNSADFRY